MSTWEKVYLLWMGDEKKIPLLELRETVLSPEEDE